jgi:cystathionine gamma-synthase
VTEVPTNPLVQTPDLEALRALADKYNAALILDPTLVSPHNVNVLSYSDLHINSLTKYAGSDADVMMGALALNSESRFYDDLRATVAAFGTAPSSGDLARMAVQIQRYPEMIRAVNASTLEVAAFLEAHPGVESVYWAKSQPAGYNYNWLQHLEAGPGGIITFTTRNLVAQFYDPSHIVKSPSFGARFTMMCPFMYLAHYDLVKTEDGRRILREHGVEPDLIRLSIGLEPAGAIIKELERTLS